MNVSRQPAAGQTEHQGCRPGPEAAADGGGGADLAGPVRETAISGGRGAPGVVDWATKWSGRAGGWARRGEGCGVVGMRRQRPVLTEVEVGGVGPAIATVCTP